MEIKRYVGIGTNANKVASDTKMTIQPETGKRVQHTVVKNTLETGELQEEESVFEEVIPLRLTSKITRKVQPVSVEEKTETFGEDGSVETKIRTIPQQNLTFDATDETVASALKSLAAKVDALTNPKQAFVPECQNTVKSAKEENKYTAWARAKFGSKKKVAEDGLSNDQPVPAKSGTQILIEWVMLAAAGLAAGLAAVSFLS